MINRGHWLRDILAVPDMNYLSHGSHLHAETFDCCFYQQIWTSLNQNTVVLLTATDLHNHVVFT